jgi:hypothetical protein
MIVLIEFKQLYTDPLFLVKIGSYKSIFAFTSVDTSLMENARIDEQLAKKTSFVFKEQYVIVSVRCYLLHSYQGDQALLSCTLR